MNSPEKYKDILTAVSLANASDRLNEYEEKQCRIYNLQQFTSHTKIVYNTPWYVKGLSET